MLALTLPADEALGSKREKPMGERPLYASRPSFLLQLLGGWCALLLRFSRVNNVKDWIAQGSFPMYPLWLRQVAQKGVSPPAIRSLWVTWRRQQAPHHPFHCWASYSQPWGYSCLFLIFMTVLAMMRRVLLLPLSAHNLR